MRELGPTRRGILKGMLALGVAIAVPAFRLTEKAAHTAVREVKRVIGKKDWWWLTDADADEATRQRHLSWRIGSGLEGYQDEDDRQLRALLTPPPVREEVVLEAVEAEEV